MVSTSSPRVKTGCIPFSGAVCSTEALTLDRAEGARYIGLAAGYAEIQKDHITRLIKIPVIEVKEGGIFRKQQVAKPDILNAVLRLGPHQIETGIGD